MHEINKEKNMWRQNKNKKVATEKGPRKPKRRKKRKQFERNSNDRLILLFLFFVWDARVLNNLPNATV